MPYVYEYPRPALTVDIIIFLKEKEGTKILLIQRGNNPFEGCWALSGGFVDINETLEEAVKRELQEETGLQNIQLFQFYTFGDLNRDPRGRTVSVVYYGFIKAENSTVKGGDDARDAKWFSLKNLPVLAFDHSEIIEKALAKIVFPS